MTRFLAELWQSARSFARTPGSTSAVLVTMAIGIGGNVSILGFVRGLTSNGSPVTRAGLVSIFMRDSHGRAGPLSWEEYAAVRDSGAFDWIGAARLSQGEDGDRTEASVTPELASLLDLQVGKGVVVSYRAAQQHRDAPSDVAGIAPAWLDGLYLGHPVDLWTALTDEGGRNYWPLGRLRRGAAPLLPGGIAAVPYTGMLPDTAEGMARVSAALGAAAVAVFFVACGNLVSFVLGRASARSRETSLRVALGASRGQLARGLLADTTVLSLAGGALGLALSVWTSQLLPALLFERDAERMAFAPDVWSSATAAAAAVCIAMAFGLAPAFALPHKRPAEILRRESSGPSRGIRRMRAALVVAQMASCCALAISSAVLSGGLRSALRTSAGKRMGQPILASVETTREEGLRHFRNVERAARSFEGITWVEWADRPPGLHPSLRSFHIEPSSLPLREVWLETGRITPASLDFFRWPPAAGRLFGFEDRGKPVAVVNEAAAETLFGSETAGRTVEDGSRRRVEIIGVLAERRSSARLTIYYDADWPGTAGVQAGYRAQVATRLERAELDVNVVSPGYFEAMGFSLLKGQYGGAIVNRAAADLYFKGNAIGAAAIDDRGRRNDIVGVVEGPVLGTFQRRADPAIYLPMSRNWVPRMTMIAGARRSDERMAAELRLRIEAVPGGGASPVVVKTLETHLSQTSLAPLRIATLLMGACATAALLLAALGLFGAMSDAARQRRRESAVRVALGAQRRHVIGQALWEGGRLALAGAVTGAGMSVALWRWLARIAPDAGAPALWVWLAVPAALLAAVAAASVLPARGALMANPLSALREE